MPQHAAVEGQKAGRAFAGGVQRGAKGAFSGVEKELSQTTRGALAGSGAFTHLGRSLAFAGATFLGTAKAVDLFRQSIASATDEQKQLERASVLFKDSAKGVKDFADGAAKSLGLSSGAAMKFTNDLGQMLTPLKLAPAASAAVSVELTKLAGNLASLRHEDPETVMAKLTAALRGRGGALKAYGIILNDTTLKEEALRLGLVKAGADPEKVQRARENLAIATAKLADTEKKYAGQGDTTQVLGAKQKQEDAQRKLNAAVAGSIPPLTAAQKQTAALSILQGEAGKHAQDFSKHSKDLANVQAVLHAEIENTKNSIGVALLPLVTKVTTAMADWLGKSENQKKVQQEVTAAVKTFASVMSTAWDVLKTVVAIAKPVVDALGGVKHAIELIVALKIAAWVSGSLAPALARAAIAWEGVGAGATAAAAETTVATGVMKADAVALSRANAFSGVTRQIEGVGASATTSAVKAGRLSKVLMGLSTMSSIAIPITLLITASVVGGKLTQGLLAKLGLGQAAADLQPEPPISVAFPGAVSQEVSGGALEDLIPVRGPGGKSLFYGTRSQTWWTNKGGRPYNFLRLKEAAAYLGVSVNELFALRSVQMGKYKIAAAKQAAAVASATQGPASAVTGGGAALLPPTSLGVATGRGDLLQGEHRTDGLPGFPAVDIKATPGEQVQAPENGRLLSIRGNDPASGSHGAAGVLGYSLYFFGADTATTYYMTHLLKVAPVGNYKKGDVIALVAAHPRGTHLHIGFHKGFFSAPPSSQAPTLARGTAASGAPAPAPAAAAAVATKPNSLVPSGKASVGIRAQVRGGAALPSGWAEDVLSAVGAPHTPSNVAFLQAWQKREGGSTQNTATFNPLCTTLPAAGSVSINKYHVQAYPDWSTGAQATADTLSKYPAIIAMLKSGWANQDYPGVGKEFLKWSNQAYSWPGGGGAPSLSGSGLHVGTTPSAAATPAVIGMGLLNREKAAQRAVTAAESKGDSAIAKAIHAEQRVEDAIIAAAKKFLAGHPKMKKAVNDVIQAALNTKTELQARLDAALSKKALSFMFARPAAEPAFVTGHPAGLVETGNIDIMNRPSVPTPGKPGFTSSVRTISISEGKGRVILIPTVIRVGGKWQVVSNAQAIAHYKKTGEHLGIFRTEAEAEAYAEKLHKQQEKLVTDGAAGKAAGRGPSLQVQLQVAQTRVDRSGDKGFTAQESALKNLEDVDRRIIAAARTAKTQAKTADARKIIQDLIDARIKDITDIGTALGKLRDANRKAKADEMAAGTTDVVSVKDVIGTLVKFDPSMVVTSADQWGRLVETTVGKIIEKAKGLIRAWEILAKSASSTPAQLAKARAGIESFFGGISSAVSTGASAAAAAVEAAKSTFQTAFGALTSQILTGFDRQTAAGLAAMQAASQAQITAIQNAAQAQIASLQAAAENKIKHLQEALQKKIKELQKKLKEQTEALERERAKQTLAEKHLSDLEARRSKTSETRGLADAQTGIAQARIGGDPEAIKQAQRQLDDFLLEQEIALTAKQAEASRVAEDESVRLRQESLAKKEAAQEESLTKQEAAAEAQIQKELAARIEAINAATAAQVAALQEQEAAAEAEYQDQREAERRNFEATLNEWAVKLATGKATWAEFEDWLKKQESVSKTAGGVNGAAFAREYVRMLAAAYEAQQALLAGGDPSDVNIPSPSGSGSGNCFVAGTLISTPAGDRPIEEILIGERVFTWDFALEQPVEATVVETFAHVGKSTLYLATERGTIQTTPEHRFWTGTEWKAAGYLIPGQSVVSLQGPVVVQAVGAGELADVFNLHVDHPDHNYFAGGLLVHNKKSEFAQGGEIPGPITGKDDRFALVTGGETVIDRRLTQALKAVFLDGGGSGGNKGGSDRDGDPLIRLVELFRESLREQKKHTDLLEQPIKVHSNGRNPDKIAFEASR